MGIVEFLFGSKPKIKFTEDGRTKHELSNKKWQDWKDRFEKNPLYNWREHSGTKSGKKSDLK